MSPVQNPRAPLPSSQFFRFGAMASCAAVVGILAAQVVLTPARPGSGMDALIRAYADPTFQAQSLTILAQVMAMFAALVALAVKLFPAAPGLSILAAASLVMWQVLEIGPRSIEYFVFSREYAPMYVAGVREAFIAGEFERFLAWERGWRSMRQVVWAAGLLLIGLAAWRASGLGRLLAAAFILNGLRVAALFVASMVGASIPFARGMFVIVNGVCFGLLAVWLWTSPRLELGAIGDSLRYAGRPAP